MSSAAVSRNDERELRAPQFFVFFDIRLFENVNDVIPQMQRIADVFELEGMLLQSRHAGKIHDGSHRYNEVVVGNTLESRPETWTRRYDLLVEVDGLYFAHVQVRALAEAPNRIDDVLDFDTSGDNLRKHGLENEVVFAVEQRDFDIILAPERFFQVHRGVHTAETTSENDNVLYH